MLLLSLAAVGCYRTTSLDLAELDRIEPLPDEKLSVRYTDGSTQTYVADRARVVLRSGAKSRLEAPLSAQVDRDTLRLVDAKGEQSYSLGEVAELKLQARAPERPWVIVGAALGAGLVGAVIGAEANSCTDKWDCTGPEITGVAGFMLGASVGVGLTIPLSGFLSPEEKSRSPSVDP